MPIANVRKVSPSWSHENVRMWEWIHISEFIWWATPYYVRLIGRKNGKTKLFLNIPKNFHILLIIMWNRTMCCLSDELVNKIWWWWVANWNRCLLFENTALMNRRTCNPLIDYYGDPPEIELTWHRAIPEHGLMWWVEGNLISLSMDVGSLYCCSCPCLFKTKRMRFAVGWTVMETKLLLYHEHQ